MVVDDENCHGQDQQRPKYHELERKDDNWLRTPEHNLYNAHLESLTRDAPKLLVLKILIDQLGQDINGRPGKLVVFTSLPVVNIIVGLVCLSFFYKVVEKPTSVYYASSHIHDYDDIRQ